MHNSATGFVSIEAFHFLHQEPVTDGWSTGSPSLQFVLTVALRDLYIYLYSATVNTNCKLGLPVVEVVVQLLSFLFAVLKSGTKSFASHVTSVYCNCIFIWVCTNAPRQSL